MKNLIRLVYLIGIICAVKSESCGPISSDDVNLIFIKDFHNYSFKNVSLKNAEKLIKDPAFNIKRHTLIYSHDFLEDSRSKSAQNIIYPFLKRGDFNVIILDTGKYFNGNYYFDAVPNTVKIGKLLVETLVNLKESHGLEMDKILLVGFSLGAHLMGYAGRTIKSISNNTLAISQIVGLDPAGPGFFPLNPYLVALNKNDADYVQIIHTDTENFGISVGTGHADFWPNSGNHQPNCPPFDKTDILREENQCSHMRAVYYYAESVFKKNYLDFHAILCDSWDDFKNHNCFSSHSTPVNNLGFNANSKLHGNFYLRTNGQPRYSRDTNGIFYIDNLFASLNLN